MYEAYRTAIMGYALSKAGACLRVGDSLMAGGDAAHVVEIGKIFSNHVVTPSESRGPEAIENPGFLFPQE